MAKAFEVKTVYRAVDRVTATLNKIRLKLNRFTAGGARAMNKLNRSVSKVASKISGPLVDGIRMATAALGLGLGAALYGVVRAFSSIEDATAAFTPVLGGAKKAKEMVDALNETAATTPFQFDNLADAARQLLPNMGGDIEETIKRIRMLGDVSGGQADKMSSIVRGYNKALLKGKVDMESLNMIGEAGVPIVAALGKTMGLSGEQLFKAVSSGKVGTADLTKTLEQMTSKGGMYFNGMKIASETLTGRISTLKDGIKRAAGEFGAALAPTLKEVVQYFTEIAQKAEDWFKANKNLIKSKIVEYIKLIRDNMGTVLHYGKKLAVIAGAFYGIATAIKIVNGMFTVLNIIMAANPFILLFYAVIAAMAIIYLFRDEIDAVLFKFFDWCVEIGEAISSFFSGIWDETKQDIQSVVDFFTSVWDTIGLLIGAVVDIFSGRWTEAGAKFVAIWDKMKAAAKSAFDWILGKVEKVVSIAGSVWSAVTGGGQVKVAAPGGAAPPFSGPVLPKSPSAPAFSPPVLSEAPASVSPSVVNTRSEAVSREQTEVTLRDETGRARVTKGGKSPSFKLVHTGGMP